MDEPDLMSVVIQAGGQSRRMGQDKALLVFHERPLISHLVDRFRVQASELLVITNRPEAYEFLDVPLISDVAPGRGALGGLFTALKSAAHPLVGIVACDMPFANPALLSFQRRLMANRTYDAAIPQTEQGWEPFHAVYRRGTCLPAVEAALNDGLWRVNSWVADVQIRFLAAEETQVIDPQQLAFWNLNTPEDYLQAKKLADDLWSDHLPGSPTPAA